MKKRWLFVILLVGALAIGAPVGTALAQGHEVAPPLKSFVARVAAILGIDEAKVQQAFNQAAKEIQDEALKAKLDKMVEQGRITQQQADEYLKWYQSRPGGSFQGLPFGGFGGKEFHHGLRQGGKAPHKGGRPNKTESREEAPKMPSPKSSAEVTL